MITRQQFKAFADLLNEHQPFFESYSAFTGFCNRLADYLETQNPIFDRDIFLERCTK